MTTADLLRALQAQRHVLRWYDQRARELDEIAALGRLGDLTAIADGAARAAFIVRTAAHREAEPEKGA